MTDEPKRNEADCHGKGFSFAEAIARAKAAAVEFLEKKFPGATIVPLEGYVVKDAAGGGVELTPVKEEQKKKILEMLIASRRESCGDPECKWCRIERGLKGLDATFEAKIEAYAAVWAGERRSAETIAQEGTRLTPVLAPGFTKHREIFMNSDQWNRLLELSTVGGTEAAQLLELTESEEQHPEDYEGSCRCKLCQSYGD